MLILPPSMMVFRHKGWIAGLQAFCCALALLFPKVMCSLILTWSFYVYITDAVYSNLYARGKPISAIIFWILGSILYGLSMFTYFLVIKAGPGSPLDFPELRIRRLSSLQPAASENPFDHQEANLPPPPSSTSTSSNVNDFVTSRLLQEDAPDEPPTQFLRMNTSKGDGYRYCPKCSCWKPDRCHHCLSCNKCVLKMDHHCPWFSTCIGFHNQKFFVQFLLYIAAYAFVVFVVDVSILYKFFLDGAYEDEFLSLSLVFLFVLSLSFCFALIIFSSFLVYLVAKNTTTIETHEARWRQEDMEEEAAGRKRKFKYDFGTGSLIQQANIYDLGWKRNLETVFGQTWTQWLLPVSITNTSIYEENSGLNFEVNEQVYQRWKQDSELQKQLNRQMEEYARRQREERQEMV